MHRRKRQGILAGQNEKVIKEVKKDADIGNAEWFGQWNWEEMERKQNESVCQPLRAIEALIPTQSNCPNRGSWVGKVPAVVGKLVQSRLAFGWTLLPFLALSNQGLSPESASLSQTSFKILLEIVLLMFLYRFL